MLKYRRTVCLTPIAVVKRTVLKYGPRTSLHSFIYVAIVDGSGDTAVGAAPGHAASAREAAKVRKYQPICDRIDAQFRGAVIERHGHCGDGMCSIIKLLSGDGERDLMQEDTSFTAPSRTTLSRSIWCLLQSWPMRPWWTTRWRARSIASPGGVGRGAEHFFLPEAWPAIGRLFLCSWHSSWDSGRVNSVA